MKRCLFTYVAVLPLLISGCTFTSLEKKQFLKALNTRDISESVGLTLKCDNRVYGFMVFPIIPMPPIIPSFDDHAHSSGVRVFPFIKHNTGNAILISVINENGNVIYSNTYNQAKQSYFHIPKTCKSLDRNTIQITLDHDSIKYEYVLRHEQGSWNVEFVWAGPIKMFKTISSQ